MIQPTNRELIRILKIFWYLVDRQNMPGFSVMIRGEECNIYRFTEIYLEREKRWTKK